jgi:hypothetical protein
MALPSFREYKKAVKENLQLLDKQLNISSELYKLQCSAEKKTDYEDLLMKLLTVRVQVQKNLEIKNKFVDKLYNKRMKREIRLNIRNYYDSIASRTRNHEKTQILYDRNCITIPKISKTYHREKYFPDKFT